MLKIKVSDLYKKLDFEGVTTIIEPYGTSCKMSHYIWLHNKEKNYKYILNNHTKQPQFTSFYKNANVEFTNCDDMECFNFDLEYLHNYQNDKQNLILLIPQESYIGNRVNKYLCGNKNNINAKIYLCRIGLSNDHFFITVF